MVDDRVWRSVRIRGASIVLVITGNSIRAGRLARAVFRRRINVRPILYPAVPERAARSSIAHSGLWEVSPKCRGLSDNRRRASRWLTRAPVRARDRPIRLITRDDERQ